MPSTGAVATFSTPTCTTAASSAIAPTTITAAPTTAITTATATAAAISTSTPPPRYYPVGFYGRAYNPWAAPIAYSWGWGAAPWYGFYGAYFTPYPVYPSAAFWLTDYLIATSLQAVYAAQAADAQA